jgi:hypothetical protein
VEKLKGREYFGDAGIVGSIKLSCILTKQVEDVD